MSKKRKIHIFPDFDYEPPPYGEMWREEQEIKKKKKEDLEKKKDEKE